MMLGFFILRSFNVRKYINRCLNTELSLRSWKRLHLARLLPPCSLVLFAGILFGVFAFISEIGLECACARACHLCSGFGIDDLSVS